MTIVVLFLDMDIELRGCVAVGHVMPGRFLCRGLIKVPGIWHLNSVYFSCLFNFSCLFVACVQISVKLLENERKT